MGALAKGKDEKKAATPAPAAAAAPAGKGDLADFLEKPAAEAMKTRQFGRAISLYRGIVAIRGDADDAVWELEKAWVLAGEFESASEELERYREVVTDAGKKQQAEEEIVSLGKRPKGFGKPFQPEAAQKEAEEAFKRGRDYYKKKKYAEAVLLFKAGIVMSPDTAGNYRELGAAYDALNKTDEANQFFVRYLRIRPFGDNSKSVRDRLEKAKMVGKLSVDSSFPCDQVWINRQIVPVKLPIKDVSVAPGHYKLLCFSDKYHMATYEYVDVTKGAPAKVQFNWAVLVNKLDPWGRVVLENPNQAGEMNDVGLFDEIGVPTPTDRRALKVQLRAGDGSKTKDMLIKIEPGKKIDLTW